MYIICNSLVKSTLIKLWIKMYDQVYLADSRFRESKSFIVLSSNRLYNFCVVTGVRMIYKQYEAKNFAPLRVATLHNFIFKTRITKYLRSCTLRALYLRPRLFLPIHDILVLNTAHNLFLTFVNFHNFVRDLKENESMN